METAEVDAADQWWSEQSAARKVQICRWITQRRSLPAVEIPGQLQLLGGHDGGYESAVEDHLLSRGA